MNDNDFAETAPPAETPARPAAPAAVELMPQQPRYRGPAEVPLPLIQCASSDGGSMSQEALIERRDPDTLRTEDLLNRMIAECHFLMREVAFRSMCQTTDTSDRLNFMTKAMDLAKTGAKVAGRVVQLRGGSVPVSETRQRIVVERVERSLGAPALASSQGEGGMRAP